MKHISRLICFLLLALAAITASAQDLSGRTFDNTALIKPPYFYDSVLLFEDTALYLSEEEVADNRGSRSNGDPVREARSDILDAFLNEFRYSSRSSRNRTPGSLDGAQRQRTHTMNLLTEHLSAEDQETLKSNFMKIIQRQAEWNELEARVSTMWITSSLEENLKPDLYAGTDDAPVRYFDMVNGWVRDYQNNNNSINRAMIRSRLNSFRRYEYAPDLKLFLENLIRLVEQGLVSSVPVER